MLKLASPFLFLLTILLFTASGICADKLNYDKFYESSEKFRKMDEELNFVYKKLMEKCSWQEKRVLLDEQRKWHNRLFAILLDSASGASDEEKAISVLKARIDDLKKLGTADNADSIMGMPVHLGMSRDEVAQKLGIANLKMLDPTSPDSDQAYRIKLFGEDIPVSFKFMNTIFLPCENEECQKGFTTFIRTLKKEFPAGKLESNAQAYEVSALYDVGVSDLENREDFVLLNEQLAKKYKRAYPLLPRLATLLDENGFLAYGKDDEDIANSAHQFFYEDRKRFIITAGDWGTVSGSFGVDYLSRLWLDLHIPSVNALLQTAAMIPAYENSLLFLPNDASLNDVMYAIGNRNLSYFQGPENYYYLCADYNDESMKASVNVYMTPENKAFAVTISYVDSDYPDFEKQLLARLDKKYKKLSATPENVLHFIGYGNNYDSDFESGQNYIHFGSTPHFAIQHELTIIDKKALPAYEKAWQKQEELNKGEDERHREQARQDSQKF